LVFGVCTLLARLASYADTDTHILTYTHSHIHTPTRTDTHTRTHTDRHTLTHHRQRLSPRTGIHLLWPPSSEAGHPVHSHTTRRPDVEGAPMCRPRSERSIDSRAAVPSGFLSRSLIRQASGGRLCGRGGVGGWELVWLCSSGVWRGGCGVRVYDCLFGWLRSTSSITLGTRAPPPVPPPLPPTPQPAQCGPERITTPRQSCS
jgi:hypothetical protein